MASIHSDASEPNSNNCPRRSARPSCRIWGLLPPDVQQHLFEEATSHGAETRTQLALYLHDKHPRTRDFAEANAMIEPDSLGG